MMHRVRDLSPEQKLAVESLLGRSVSEDDSVSIKALPSTVITRTQLSKEQRKAAAEELEMYFARMDAQRQPVSREEEEEIITEALRSTRANYRPIG
jgi:hypothetical protein